MNIKKINWLAVLKVLAQLAAVTAIFMAFSVIWWLGSIFGFAM